MSPQEQAKILNDYAHITSRLTTKMIPKAKLTFDGIDVIDLIMSLPIKYKLEEVNVAEIPPKKDGSPVTEQDVAIGGYITRDTENGNPDRLIVFLIFTKDINTTWGTFFNNLLSDQFYQNMLLFAYMHEALHILLRHYDFYLNAAYTRIINSIKPELAQSTKDEILNHAFDYWINAYLIEEARHGSVINSFSEKDSGFMGLYDANLSPIVKTQQEIVEVLTKNMTSQTQDILNTSGEKIGEITETTINGNTSTSIRINGSQSDITQEPKPSDAEQEIDDVLKSTKDNMLQKTKGSASQKALTKLGVDYSVPTDWFKLLKQSVFNIVRHHTSQYDQTWGKLKNKFRHVAMMPGKIYYEKEFAAVISIDQSGSMSDQDLEKINYVVSELAKQATFVEILLHDTSIVESKTFRKKEPLKIRDFITNRVACGGTSHRPVFERIETMQAQNKKLKLIYLSFSDNYSDIEKNYSFDVFRNISTYWIFTDGGKPVDVPGMQISLENGLLQS